MAEKRPFLRRGPSGPLAKHAFGVVQVGWDQSIDSMNVPSTDGAFWPRDIAGNPIKVVLPDVEPGNQLEVDWRLNLAAAIDNTYPTDFDFSAIAVVTFDGSVPSLSSVTTFFIAAAGGVTHFADVISEGTTADKQSISGLASVTIPDGATTATVELVYVTTGNTLVTGTTDDPTEITGMAATLKVTEFDSDVVTQPGPGNLVAAA